MENGAGSRAGRAEVVVVLDGGNLDKQSRRYSDKHNETTTTTHVRQERQERQNNSSNTTPPPPYRRHLTTKTKQKSKQHKKRAVPPQTSLPHEDDGAYATPTTMQTGDNDDHDCLASATNPAKMS